MEKSVKDVKWCVNLFTAMLATYVVTLRITSKSAKKLEMITVLSPPPPPPPPSHQHVRRTCINMHSTESTFVTGPSNTPFSGVYAFNFQPPFFLQAVAVTGLMAGKGLQLSGKCLTTMHSQHTHSFTFTSNQWTGVTAKNEINTSVVPRNVSRAIMENLRPSKFGGSAHDKTFFLSMKQLWKSHHRPSAITVY